MRFESLHSSEQAHLAGFAEHHQEVGIAGNLPSNSKKDLKP
jgi:hypothetical protein